MKSKNITKLMALSLAMCLGFGACGGGSGGNSSPSGNTTEDKYVFTERTIQEVGQTYNNGIVTYPNELWEKPEFEYCEELDYGGVGDVKGIFYTSPITYNGKKTKIAAYIGFPEGATAENKVPAIVLVHGGLGTAFPDWVKYWNDLGFAAISIDTEGGEPSEGVNNFAGKHIERNRWANDDVYTAGPTNNGYANADKPLNEQWMYHATSATILAVSLIRSFDCVDKQKVGITGISWGSTITNIVIGYDDRLTFALPIYSCLTCYDRYPNQLAIDTWGDPKGLEQTHCKTFYVTGVRDNTPIDAVTRCAAMTEGFCLFKMSMPHGQEYGSLEGNLPYYARYICGMESEFVEIMHNPTLEDPTLKFRTYGDVSIKSIKIYYTEDEAINTSTSYESKAVKVIEGCTEYTLNVPDCTYAFVTVKYNNNLEVSSYLFEGNL